MAGSNKSKTYVSAFLCRYESPVMEQRLPTVDHSCNASNDFDMADLNQVENIFFRS
jgi:hypothetical protein